MLLFCRETSTSLGVHFKRTHPENNSSLNSCIVQETELEDDQKGLRLHFLPSSLSLRTTLRNMVKGSFSVFVLCQLLTPNETMNYISETGEDEIVM